MAETTGAAKKSSTAAKKTQATKEPEELNLDTKVTVKSIADWTVGFARRADGYAGDITISPKGSIRLSRNEIITQVQNGNKLFNGLDGVGSHATLIIEDKPTRIEAGFETEDTEQKVFSDKLISELFAIHSSEGFQMQFKECIRTRAEKYAAIDAIKRLGINDYSKIRFVEDYTGYKL
jgi:hypothetical protein